MKSAVGILPHDFISCVTTYRWVSTVGSRHTVIALLSTHSHYQRRPVVPRLVTLTVTGSRAYLSSLSYLHHHRAAPCRAPSAHSHASYPQSIQLSTQKDMSSGRSCPHVLWISFFVRGPSDCFFCAVGISRNQSWCSSLCPASFDPVGCRVHQSKSILYTKCLYK